MDDLPLNVSTHPPKAHEERKRESDKISRELKKLMFYAHILTWALVARFGSQSTYVPTFNTQPDSSCCFWNILLQPKVSFSSCLVFMGRSPHSLKKESVHKDQAWFDFMTLIVVLLVHV